jgi:hypothetical protein
LVDAREKLPSRLFRRDWTVGRVRDCEPRTLDEPRPIQGLLRHVAAAAFAYALLRLTLLP